MKRLLLWIAVPLMLLGAGVVFVVSPSTVTGRGDVPVARTSARPGGGAVAAAARRSTNCTTGTCWVAVNVATLWVDPRNPQTAPRPIDHPALTNPTAMWGWVNSMTVAQKLWLVGKLETQVLYGVKVEVTGDWISPARVRWEHVVVPSQPTNRDRRGYPGWVPARQLTTVQPMSTGTTAVVRSRTAWLWGAWSSAGGGGSKVMQVSNATMLPVAEATSAYVVVTLLGGQHAALRRSDVAVHPAGQPWGATRTRIVNEAKKFLGRQYLWAGTSGYGYDCSGLTYSVYRDYGIRLPRDAGRQAVHGTPVARSALRPGDLVFYQEGRAIGHVGMYVGSGHIIDAPQTGQPVKIEPMGSPSSARRYL